MSPVKHSGGESLQEMIDRYNRELMKMGSGNAVNTGKEQSVRTPAPAAHRQTDGQDKLRPRPEPAEPLYGKEPRPLRPEAREPLDEPRTPEAAREYSQGIKDILQGQRDREQGERDIRQAQRDREQGERDIRQAQRDRKQGLRDRQQGQWEMKQTGKDMMHAREDLLRGLEELREGLRELEQLQREYLNELSGREHHRTRSAAEADAFDSPAVLTAAGAGSSQEQWLRDLEQGRQELEQGLRDLEQGLRDKEQGEKEYRQGLAEREYWQNLSRQASAPVQERSMSEQPETVVQEPLVIRNPDGTVPTLPTVPGRVTAQSQPGEQPEGGGYGTLIVQAYTARRAEPVAGAQVVVTRSSGSEEVLYGIMHTDIDGRTPPLQLPVDRQTGENAPYAIYRVYVSASGYQPSGRLSAQIFPGITGILPVELVPGNEGVL